MDGIGIRRMSPVEMDAACTVIVLSWLQFHPGPAEIAKGLRADVDEIERLCADVAVSGFTKRAAASMTSVSVTRRRIP